MTKTRILERCGGDDAARLTLARVLDKAELARVRGVPAATRFLTDGEQALAQRALAAFGAPRYALWGGYEGAERKVFVFLPDWAEELTPELDPLAAVEVRPGPAGADLTHRDYLGSLTGLGLTRETVGDLLVGEGRCQAVCLQETLPILLAQWTQVGRHEVRAQAIELSELAPGTRRVKRLRETFRSLRFDAVAAVGFGIPRSKAAALIASGRIQLDHLPCDKPDRILAPGDTLTAKGLGKCVLVQVSGETKKGRLCAELERYL